MNINVSAALRQLADSFDAANGVPVAAPVAVKPAPAPVPKPVVVHTPHENDVAVQPTGVHGVGITRYWPKTLLIPSVKPGMPPGGDINYLSYLNRMMGVINPDTAVPYCTPGNWGDAFLGGHNPADSFQVLADKHMHPSEWTSQADIDRAQAIAKAQQGAAWISTPPAPQPVSGDVPIDGQ